MIDQIITLKALDKAVFHDDKEGVLGMRVAHWLESPDEKGGIFMDANGNPTKVDSAGSASPATGVYLTSEGVKGPAVWSTRGRWCTLTGNDPAAIRFRLPSSTTPATQAIRLTGMRADTACSPPTHSGGAFRPQAATL